MPKSLSAALILKKNTLDPQSPWLELYELTITLTTTLRLTNHPTPIVYQSKTYMPYPIRHDAIKEESQGRIQKVTVHVSNVLREVQYYLEQFDGLRGQEVKMILVNLDDLTAGDLRQSFIIESVSANEEVASFVLGKPIPLLDIRLPGRRILRDLFPGVVR